MPAPADRSGCATTRSDRGFVGMAWILLVALLGLVAPIQASAASALSPYESNARRVSRSAIDDFIFPRLAALEIEPARPVSEAAFLRRIHLDLIGRLPTAEETRKYLSDTDGNKRSKRIDLLLARPEFAEYWSLKWSDLLRVKAEYPINLWPNAAQAYHRWIYGALQDGMPLDQFARTLLVSSGSNFHNGPVNFYRAIPARDPLSLAKAVALTFLGIRPESLSAEQWSGLAGFFSQVGYKSTGEWKEEIVFWDPTLSPPSGVGPARFPDGTVPQMSPDRDPRQVFADWMLAADNRWFARVLANRIWAWVMGRGIVQEPDDFRADNPPSHPELLDALAEELVASHYSLKHLFRIIVNSQAYQLSCVPQSDDPRAASLFAVYPLRRLEGEVLIDALNDITGTTETYSSAIPEPYTFVPANVRAVALPDGSITSSFLELFGRPPRDSGLESERNNRMTAGQRLHLLNSTHIRRKIEQGPRIAELLRSPPRRVVDDIFLTVLSRPPTDDERRAVQPTLKPGPAGRAATFDLIWALINSDEFLHRH